MTQIADRIAEAEAVIGRGCKFPEPTKVGAWIVFDQPWSRGLCSDYAAQLTKAGIPAFFRAAERRFGIKAPA